MAEVRSPRRPIAPVAGHPRESETVIGSESNVMMNTPSMCLVCVELVRAHLRRSIHLITAHALDTVALARRGKPCEAALCPCDSLRGSTLQQEGQGGPY